MANPNIHVDGEDRPMTDEEFAEWTNAPKEPPPPAEPKATPQEIALDHENRILALEGKPPLTLDEFLTR